MVNVMQLHINQSVEQRVFIWLYNSVIQFNYFNTIFGDRSEVETFWLIDETFNRMQCDDFNVE